MIVDSTTPSSPAQPPSAPVEECPVPPQAAQADWPYRNKRAIPPDPLKALSSGWRELFKAARVYSALRLAKARAALVNSVVRLAVFAVGGLFLLVLCVVWAVFMTLGLATWIGQASGRLWLGYLLAGFVPLALVAGALWRAARLARRRAYEKAVARYGK